MPRRGRVGTSWQIEEDVPGLTQFGFREAGRVRFPPTYRFSSAESVKEDDPEFAFCFKHPVPGQPDERRYCLHNPKKKGKKVEPVTESARAHS